MQNSASPELKPHRRKASSGKKTQVLQRQASSGKKISLTKEERKELNEAYKNAETSEEKKAIANYIREISSRRAKRKPKINFIPEIQPMSIPASMSSSLPSTYNTTNMYTYPSDYFQKDTPQTVISRGNKERKLDNTIKLLKTGNRYPRSYAGGKRTRKNRK